MDQRPIIKPAVKEQLSTLVGVLPNGNPISVLVVDDEVSHRKIMTQIIKSIGFEVVAEVADGSEAVYQFKALKPQIVTLDYHMPRMNGLAALKEIKKTDPNAIVLMSTSIKETDIVKRILKEGAAEYIVKPFERKLLIEKLTNLVHRFFQK